MTRKVKYILIPSSSALLLLFIGWYFISTNQNYQPKTVSNFDYEIVYTSNGYSPSFLKVPLGSRVAFKNASKIPMWTASDPHPTHTDYSGFDARKDYKNGEIYIFKFTKTGTFSFHNHERSLDRGIIQVYDPKNPLTNIDKTKEGQRVVRDKYLNMFISNQPASIFTVIDKIEADPVLSKDCHDMSHDLGHKAYELYGFSGAMTFSDPQRLSHPSADDICAGGYMHGILEELFLHQPELKDNPGPICAGIPEINRASCFHGVGHGLMFVDQRNVTISLSTCRQLKSSDIYRCFEGVWMEMFWGLTDHSGGDSLGWTVDKPLEPCIEAKADEKPTCFLYAHLGYLRTHHADFAGALSLCTNNNLSDADENFCLKGIGITMMKHVTSHHLENSEALVAGLNDDKKYAYYQGVVGYARLSNVSEQALQTFCSNLQTDTAICQAVVKNDPR
jgi:plastocyanin